MTSIILYTASRFLLTLMLLFSLWVLFRGHNAPGGGFIAGLISASAFALYLIAHGPKKLRQLVHINLFLLLSIGLSLTLISGLIGIFSQKPFLTGTWLVLKPLHLSLGTPLLFDVGIYLVVLSGILIMLLSLEESTQ